MSQVSGLLGPLKKQTIQDIAKAQQAITELDTKMTNSPNDYIAPVEAFIKEISKLLGPAPSSKFGIVQLQLSDCFGYAVTLNSIFQKNVVSKIKPELLTDLFKVVCLFATDDIPPNLFKSFEKILKSVIDVLAEVKPKNFNLFDHIKTFNYCEFFGKDLFERIFIVPTANMQYLMSGFHDSLQDEKGRTCLQTWFKSFVAEAKNEGNLQFLPYNVVYVLIEFLKYSGLEITEPLSNFRLIWSKMADQDKSNIITKFTQTIPNSINTFLPIAYLLFLYDTDSLKADLFSEICALIGTSNNTPEFFITYLACIYYFDVTNINVKQFEEFSNGISSSTVVQKTMAAHLVEFHKSTPSLINTPWKYAAMLTAQTHSNLKFGDISFDLPEGMQKRPYANLHLESLFEKKRSSLACVFISVIIDLFALCPSSLCPVDPKVQLAKQFIPGIFNRKKLSDRVIKTLTKFFSDHLLPNRISHNVYQKWLSFLIAESFNDKYLVPCTLALADFVRLNLPCCSVAAPFFLNAVQKVKGQTPHATAFANAFASCRVITLANNDTINKVQQNLNVKLPSNYRDLYNDISHIYSLATPECRADVFAAAIQAIIEDLLIGNNVDKLKEFILSRIPQLSEDEMTTLQFLVEVEDIAENLIRAIFDALVAKGSPTYVNTAVKLMIACPSISFKDYLPMLKGLLAKKDYEETKILFIENYRRYPYKDGINYPDDRFELKGDEKRLMMTSEKSTIVTQHNPEDNTIKMLIKTDNGNSAFVVRNTVENPRTESAQFSEVCDIPYPVYEPEIGWGPNATYEPFKALPETLRKVQQPNTNPIQEQQKKDDHISPSPFSSTEALQQLCFISPLKDCQYRMLDHDTSINEIKALYDIPIRAGHKVAVIFVGKEQRDQELLLNNGLDDASSNFYKFINSIGYPIDLANHPGFCGGLDNTGFSTGRKTSYWANMDHEIMWHVSTLIETAMSNGKNIYKKRHIGNDSIHVLWTEDNVEYDIAMITSQFNHGHIVVYPHANGKYSVQIFQKPGIKWFGSLRGKTIVSAAALSTFIRYTAIEADVLAREYTAAAKMGPGEKIQSRRLLQQDKVLASRKTLWDARLERDDIYDATMNFD